MHYQLDHDYLINDLLVNHETDKKIKIYLNYFYF